MNRLLEIALIATIAFLIVAAMYGRMVNASVIEAASMLLEHATSLIS